MLYSDTASHPILRLVCHLERHEVEWKIFLDFQSPLFVIATFWFLSSFVTKSSKSLFCGDLLIGRNSLLKLTDRNGALHPDLLTLHAVFRLVPPLGRDKLLKAHTAEFIFYSVFNVKILNFYPHFHAALVTSSVEVQHRIQFLNRILFSGS